MVRKSIGMTVLLTLAIALFGCGSAPPSPGGASTAPATGAQKPPAPSTQGGTVRMTIYGGQWEEAFRKAIIEKFEKETGAKVELVLGSDAEWYTKVRAANGNDPPFDLVLFNPDQINRSVPTGLLEPLDTTKLKNWQDIDPYGLRLFQFNDKYYAVTFSYGQLGLAYRKDKLQNPPTGWLDLWKPEYKGRVALPPPNYSAGLQFLSGLVRAMGGQEKNPADMDKAFAKLAELKENVSQFPNNAGAVQTLLERGDAWIVPLWDGRAIALEQSGIPVGFVYPKEGAVGSASQFSIPKGAKNRELAYKLLDYALDPGNQKIYGEAMWYGTSNVKVDFSPEFKKRIATGPDAYKSLVWVDYAVASEKLNDWQNTFNRTFGTK